MPALRLLVLLSLLSATSFATPEASALTPEQKERLRVTDQVIRLMDPHYKMDPKIKPDDPVSVGVDCSRYEYLRYKWAGVGMMRRVTSRDMAHGLGGWTGLEVQSLDDVDEHDMIWWTWSETPQKEHSHVGHFVEGEVSGLHEVSHMSATKRKLVVVPFAYKIKTDYSKIRRIEILERKK